MAIMPAVYTLEEAAQRLKVGKHSLYPYARAGKWGAFRIGKGFKVPAKAFDEWIESGGKLDVPKIGRPKKAR